MKLRTVEMIEKFIVLTLNDYDFSDLQMLVSAVG